MACAPTDVSHAPAAVEAGFMRAYRQDLKPSEFTVTYRRREYALLGCSCAHCGYDFFVPALREHEPSFCPNCGVQFTRARPVSRDDEP